MSAVQRMDTDRRALPRFGADRRSDARRIDELASTRELAQADSMNRSYLRYLILVAALCLICLMGTRAGNIHFAPLLNDPARIDQAAELMGEGHAYHTYDLNIETRRLRAQHIASLKERPYAAVMGASHWQEGVTSRIAPNVDLYNAHVHRDYYEDILGVVEMFVSQDKLPQNLLITIRENQFAPVSSRTDWLWVPIMPYYWEMAQRLGIEAHKEYLQGLTPQTRQRLSLPLLKANFTRYVQAPAKPYGSREMSHPTLDTLLPDGSIEWSEMNKIAFTPERSREMALSFAREKKRAPAVIDLFGVRSVDAVFAYLKGEGVNVYLTHPPYNPIFWDEVMKSPEYVEAIERVKQVTRDLGRRHGFEVIGSFDPYEVGCTADMYIDSEHSNTECLAKVMRPFLDKIGPDSW